MDKAAFRLRTCYVNGAEHLQNAWNVNFLYPDAPNRWSDAQWNEFFLELKAFGYNNFQFWIPPTLCVPGELRSASARKLRRTMELAREAGLMFNPLLAVNTLGAAWYFACPRDRADRRRILEFWEFYAEALRGADIFSIFPGDPGGCCRNGCTHVTFLELAVEIAHTIKKLSPFSAAEIGTWGTPFTGWGEDMRPVPDWDGTFEMLADPKYDTPEVPCHIWNGKPERVPVCMQDLIRFLPEYPPDTLVSLNLGFNPDCEPVGGYDGRPYAGEIAKTHRVTTWDYSLSEGELINYPHWRLPRMRRKRLLELESAPYHGGIVYTMTPKLNLLTLYAGGQLFIDPRRTEEEITSRFTELVFGDGKIGLLMEAFEIVRGWGHYPRRSYTRAELRSSFAELIERLTACRGAECRLPVFPGAEEYRRDLLWHAERFYEMTGDGPDRARIRKEYWDRALSIYDAIPMSADRRAELAADGYSRIAEDIG